MQKGKRLGEYYLDLQERIRVKDGKREKGQLKERIGMQRRSQKLKIVKLE